MGGDSLIATLLVDRLTETFQVNVSLASLINAPTVAEMSEVIAELQQQSIGTTASAGD
jgi:acyl carrier protein